MATSGTVSQTVFKTRQVIDRAFGRCKLPPQKITSEYIQIAKDLLFLRLSALSNKSIPLWVIETSLIPLYRGVYSVDCPAGASDVLNVNLRNLQRLSGTASSSSGDAAKAFDGDIDTTCTETAPAGSIELTLDSAARATTFGILAGATATWDISIQGSNDGTTWSDLYTNAEFEATSGEWTWIDVQNGVDYLYYRLLGGAATTLIVTEFFIGHTPNEIPLGLINRDDFVNLPNKDFLGRPTQYWLDKQRSPLVMQIWPAPALEYTFYQLVVQQTNYIQDVGTLTQELQVPQRWYLAIVAQLAADLAVEIREVDAALIPVLMSLADREMRDAEDGESDRAPTRLAPNISPYTR